MSLALAATVGALFALGTFLMLRRDLVNVVLGTAVITQGANVYLIAMGGIEQASSDRIPVLSGKKPPATADPLVQAMVLTAIVISFGMTAFVLVLAYRAYEENETMDITEWSE